MNEQQQQKKLEQTSGSVRIYLYFRLESVALAHTRTHTVAILQSQNGW